MDYLNKGKKTFLTIIALIITLFYLVPFYILITTSLKSDNDFSSKWIFPKSFSLENFANAWQQANLGNAFLNSIMITFFAAVFLIFFGSLAAYPLARRQTKLNKFIYMLFI